MYLDRVEVAVAVEREVNDVCGVPVPAGVQGTGYDVPDLRKNLRDHGPVGAHADPLTKLRSHMNHYTLALQTHTSAFPLSPPALQLGLQRSQLEERSLFIQQGVFLQKHKQHIHEYKLRNIHTCTSTQVHTKNTHVQA